VAALKSALCGRERRRIAWMTAATSPAPTPAPTPNWKPVARSVTPATLIEPLP